MEIDGKFYAYGFTARLAERWITGEWLYELYQNGAARRIFDRESNTAKRKDETVVEIDAEVKDIYSYAVKGFSDIDVKNLIWSKYLTNLRNNEAYKKYTGKDNTDTAVFNRELDRLYKNNIESAYISKMETQYKESWSFDKDGNLKDTVLDYILEEYLSIYNSNKELYNLDKTTFFSKLTSSSTRNDFVYYGGANDEKIISCTHILVKLSEKQLEDASSYLDNPLYSPSERKQLSDEVKDKEHTYAYARNDEGYVVDDEGISVEELYNNIVNSLSGINDFEGKLAKFNEYLYKYNVDPGIINAEYDYVLGRKFYKHC